MAAHRDLGHEHDTAPLRAVTLSALGLVAGLVLLGALGWWFVHRLDAREAGRSAPASLLARPLDRRTPPEPRLLADPAAALATLRAEERALLHGYAWLDRAAGVVRIPIRRAMEVLAAREAEP